MYSKLLDSDSIQVMKMCQAIAELGDEVTLFIGTNEKEEVQLKGSDVFNFYGIERAFEIKRIPLKTNSIHALLSSTPSIQDTVLLITKSVNDPGTMLGRGRRLSGAGEGGGPNAPVTR
jgi:hypothetical protein